MTAARVLIVDDEADIRDMLRLTLEYEGFTVTDVDSGISALEIVRHHPQDAVVLDVKMPGMDGMETLGRLRELDPALPVILLTGHGTIETAVEAVKRGAFDFLSKPPDREKLLIAIRNAAVQTRLARENEAMRSEIGQGDAIIGSARTLRDLLDTVARVAPTDAYVLITGENGSGKELIAQAVHRQSRRADKPLVEVNCAAIPNELIESELFGHEKGSFTGATALRIGKFEQADRGSIFLDEIGDMSMAAQAKVLRVLEEGSFERVGGSTPITVDVRVIAATNKQLPREIREGRFREDLFHRLNVIPLSVPPLRERREDIPPLVAHFLADTCRRNKLPARSIDEDALRLLSSMHWPGNVRELRNAVERLAILSAGVITSADVSRLVTGGSDALDGLLAEDLDFQGFKDRSEALYLQRQLERHEWNVSRTAETVGIQRSHLYTKIKKYGLMRAGMEEE